ncbi:outer membrane beta-barrel protein [Christiangramia sp. SM2212]|uniref:Outer membrane beta-barrel protein n=1 Tax=Christiangramia sediminicola TaxID=3073267 RepID=A0ABU1EMW9_9FLAO|nr:outer membrane beta-barrel protein [Christiangramia sp. SM2212]MDR5589732.1 outer membrane beta-barrel protein [Christiangramia sp. SM2212]
MKKLLILALILTSVGASAQSASFGIKGGLNYGATGEYESFSQVSGDFVSSFEDGEDKTGFHAGMFAQFELLGIFIQPELMYTELNTEYRTFDYKLSKIDAPVLLGLNVLGPLNIKAGPSFQYILDNKIEGSDLEIEKVEKDITVGYQLGLGFDIGRLGFDLRHEGSFQDNFAKGGDIASDSGFQIDSRPSQWILSVSYAL